VRDLAPLWRDSALVRKPRVTIAPVITATLGALQAQAEQLGLVRRGGSPRRGKPPARAIRLGYDLA